MNELELRNFAHTAQYMINDGAVESRLRHLLSSRLIRIFPDSPWWIQAHIEGTEERVHFSTDRGDRIGFVDAVVGETAIEYERNLTIQSIFDEGYNQVKEYCAALYNIGISENKILGVLSDTVRWYGYSISVVGEVSLAGLYGPDNIELNQLMVVDLSNDSSQEAERFEAFINRFLNREQSRILNANTLVSDFGMGSTFYQEYISEFESIIRSAMDERPEYARLIRMVWQNFVAYLGVSDYGEFSVDTYINEFYLVTMAKTVCVNILSNEPVISELSEVKRILDGEFFTSQNIVNFVDYDYFGWLNGSPYVDQVANIVLELQRRLIAYDFSYVSETDIFGRLLAQLANREHRLMLGQEFTPHWIARDMVNYNLDKIVNDYPRVMDMCCGSGVFLIETVRAVRTRYNIDVSNYTQEKDNIVFSCVMGFDIDPLAIMLAKVNWIMSMRDLFPLHHGEITIPIYHADSLFVATPITHNLADMENESYTLKFDNNIVTLPAFLLSAGYKKVFDGFMSRIYHLAMVRASGDENNLNDTITQRLIESVESESDVNLEDSQKHALIISAYQLAIELERLQREGRNGIWYFIISNSYRPGLMEQQFNCILSNPPWMAMSKLADNPYRNALQNIAHRYGISPQGAAHPHMELSTIFLMSATNRYLQNGGLWSCVMPGSLLSGLNHEPLRSEAYRNSDAKLLLSFSSVWELPQNTFKNKAIVLSGSKGDAYSQEILDGRVYSESFDYNECEYRLIHQGNRSAWANRGNDTDIVDVFCKPEVTFEEGCDLMPRTVLFHRFVERSDGNWDIYPIDRTSELGYLIKDSHKVCCNDLIGTNFEKRYIYDAFISKHLSPFYFSLPAKLLIPGEKEDGEWKPISEMDRALMNQSTAAVFSQIEDNNHVALEEYFRDKINMRGKLSKQKFALKDWLVLSSAGGANTCAAYISLDDYDRSRIIIDQTLYWHLAESEEEAIYLVGILNSDAIRNLIRDFQPEGSFGRRHIHTLPYKLIPLYDANESTHLEVVDRTRELMREWREFCARDEEYANLNLPNSGNLNSRRRKQQSAICKLSSFEAYESACQAAFV